MRQNGVMRFLILSIIAFTALNCHYSTEATLTRLLRRHSDDQNTTLNQDARTASGPQNQAARATRQGFFPNQGPTPFLPFGIQLPAGFRDGRMFNPASLPAGSVPPINPVPLFNNDLSKKLLSFIGVGVHTGDQNDTISVRSGQTQPDPRQVTENFMNTFRNASAMQELSKGLTGILGGLSKMYNSTVQQQLNILQTRVRRETENTTDPWHQRMLAGLPDFFKTMSARVMGAQRRLDDIYHQLTQAKNATQSNMENEEPMVGVRSRAAMFPANLMQFWHNQVVPQIDIMRGQLNHVWQELTGIGFLMLTKDYPYGSSTSSANLVDNLLKEVDTNNTDYVLFDAKSSDNNLQQLQNQAARMTSQMQTGLMTMQREINGLWSGLSKSLQGAIANVRGTRSTTSQADNNSMIVEADPAENEISAKIADISKVQREADMILNVVQQQQRQQNPGLMDRFMNMFGSTDMTRKELFSPRFTDPFMRIGDAIGDFWHEIPNHWDRFMTHVRPQPSFGGNVRSFPAGSATPTKKPDMPVIATN